MPRRPRNWPTRASPWDSISFDVTDSKAIEAGVAEIEKRHGRIDILVNNAGIQRRYPLEEFPEEEWNAVINLNLTAVFKMSKAVAKGMIARQYGKIVNICSANSAVAPPDHRCLLRRQGRPGHAEPFDGGPNGRSTTLPPTASVPATSIPR